MVMDVIQEVDDTRNNSGVQHLFDVTEFSSLGKVIRVTELVSVHKKYGKKGWSMGKDTSCATKFWVKKVQEETFENEISVLHYSSSNSPNKPYQMELSKKTLKSNSNYIIQPV